MVKLNVKRGDLSYFLFVTNTEVQVDQLIKELALIYNGILIIQRVCTELNDLSKYGLHKHTICEQDAQESDLSEEAFEIFTPKGGYVENIDPTGRRNGQAPNKEMVDIIAKTVAEAQSAISTESIAADICVTTSKLNDVVEMLSGALSIVYPMGLPNCEPTLQLLTTYNRSSEGKKDLKDALEVDATELWWAGKQLQRDKKLMNYIGKNEKTKMVVKLQKSGQGAPSREPSMSDEDRRQLMLHTYKRQEELKKLEEDADDSYLDSRWADRQGLRKNFHGIENISWKSK